MSSGETRALGDCGPHARARGVPSGRNGASEDRSAVTCTRRLTGGSTHALVEGLTNGGTRRLAGGGARAQHGCLTHGGAGGMPGGGTHTLVEGTTHARARGVPRSGTH